MNPTINTQAKQITENAIARVPQVAQLMGINAQKAIQLQAQQPKPQIQLPTVQGTNRLDTSIDAINNLQKPVDKYASINDLVLDRADDNIRNTLLANVKDIESNVNLLKSPSTSYAQDYQNLLSQAGIAEPQQRTFDLSRIIKGSENDIAGEISKAGGVASDSLLASLVNQRNKPLIEEYNTLNSLVANKMQLVDKLMEYNKLDRQSAENLVEKKFNLKDKIIDNYLKVQSLDDKALASLQAQQDKQEQRALQKLNLLMTTGGISRLPEKEMYNLSASTGIEPAVLRAAAQSVDGEKELKRQLQISQMNNAAERMSMARERSLISLDAGDRKVVTKINDSIAGNDAYKKTVSAKTFADNTLNALSLKTGAGDIAAINQFQKVIDEGAVTRDQDVKLLQGSQSLANTLRTKIKKLEKGEQLSAELRTQIQSATKELYAGQVKSLNNNPYIKSKVKEVKSYGIPVEDTILSELGGLEVDNGTREIYQTSTNNNFKIK